MFSKPANNNSDADTSIWHAWPYAIGGVGGPPLGKLLSGWLPLFAASALAAFVAWFLVGIIFAFLPYGPRWNAWRWLMVASLVGLTAGILTFVFPWT